MRNTNGNQLSLQLRDRNLLVELYQSRILTSSQLARLFFTSQNRADRRLRQLFDAGYLDRMTLPSSIPGAPRILYSVGKAAVAVIAGELGTDAKRIRRRRQLNPLFLEHQLALNTVRLAFQISPGTSTGWQFDCFIAEPDCHEIYWIENKGKPQKRVFAPDGYLRLKREQPNSETTYRGFFIELDRATIELARFKAKIRSYLEYRSFGLYPRRYGLDDFAVLIVTTSAARRDYLRQATASITARDFWLATVEDIEASGCDSPVWYHPGNKEPQQLL